jgi:hypothetical protein
LPILPDAILLQPLHVAVKANRPDLVKLLLEGGASQFLIRDANGSTPLHIAVKDNRANITKLLAAAGPVEALTLEDAVGNTPVETATRQAFLAKLDAVCSHFRCPEDLRPNYNRRPFDVVKQEKELAVLRTTIDDLLREGRLTNGTKLMKELVAFADRLERRLFEEKAAEEEKQKRSDEENKMRTAEEMFTAPSDSGTPSDILKVLADELAVRPTLRHLVHLNDVHDSVNKSLDQYNKEQREKKNEVVTRRSLRRHRHSVDEGGIPDEKEVITSQLTSFYDAAYEAVVRRWNY